MGEVLGEPKSGSIRQPPLATNWLTFSPIFPEEFALLLVLFYKGIGQEKEFPLDLEPQYGLTLRASFIGWSRELHIRLNAGPTSSRPRYNILPLQEVTVVRLLNREFRAENRPWGFDRSGRETFVTTTPHDLLRSPGQMKELAGSRCVIIADGFFLWDRGQQYFVARNNDLPFAIAGLCGEWRFPEGATIQYCTMIIRQPNPAIQQFSSWMPAILKGDELPVWLEPKRSKPEALFHLLAEGPPERELKYCPVAMNEDVSIEADPNGVITH